MPVAEHGNGGSTDAASSPWMPARLIPVAGIRGQDEQEIRAASSLLAVMGAVDEFGKALLKEIGARSRSYLVTTDALTLRQRPLLFAGAHHVFADLHRFVGDD